MSMRPALSAFVIACTLPAQQFTEVSVPLQQTVGLTMNIRSADVDQDGWTDVLLQNILGVTICYGDGVGGCRSTEYLPSFGCGAAEVVDLNQDQRPDVCMGGFGSFGQLRTDEGGWKSVPGPVFGRCLLVDVNHDGLADVVGCGMNAIWLALGGPNGDFQPTTELMAATYAMQMGDLWVGDMNGDGHVDIMSRTSVQSMLFGDGTGHFTSMLAVAGGNETAWAMADFDGDGAPDQVYGNEVWRNDGAGIFTLSHTIPGPDFVRSTAADVDGDGKIDLVATRTGDVVILPGLGNGFFGSAIHVATGACWGVGVTDLDRDGHLDIVATVYPNDVLRLFRNVSTLIGGTGTIGNGTPSCRGHIGIRATQSPVPGTSTFRIACTNTPSEATGVLLVGAPTPSATVTSFGLELSVLDPVVAAVTVTDRSGATSFALPIPDDQALLGLVVGTQAVFRTNPGVGDTCSPALFGLASTPELIVIF